jgi:lysozyme family protein
MEFSEDFKKAFTLTMQFEVGHWFNPEDQETIDGLCSSHEQKVKTGYCNVEGDSGGETKFGVAKNSNVDVDIQTLTLEGAMDIYLQRYWNHAKCDTFQGPLDVLIFDAAVNHGVPKAIKFLQRALGLHDDGQFGPGTQSAYDACDKDAMASQYLDQREASYRKIVELNPSQEKFLNGWLSRVTTLRTFVENYSN